MTAFEHAAALLTQGKSAEAATAFDELLETGHVDAPTLIHASVAHAGAGDYTAALKHAVRTTERFPEWWRGHAQAGALLLALDKPVDALPYLSRARRLNPVDVNTLNNLGAAYRTIGKTKEALSVFQDVAALAPDDDSIKSNLAGALAAQNRHGEAVPILRGMIEAGNHSEAVYNQLGKSLWKSGDLEGGIDWFQRALEINPRFPDALGHLGNALMERGDIAEGKRYLRAAIDSKPDFAEFYRLLVEADINALTEADIAALETMTGSDADRALACVYESRGEPERAFRRLLAANAEVRRTIPYEERAEIETMARLARIFTADVMRKRGTTGNPSSRPIFIVGMPRSGTTLIEQVLASHPDVYGAGELTYIVSLGDEVRAGAKLAPWEVPHDDAVLREIGDRYIAKIESIAPANSTRVTDKMPDNFRAVGLIALALPNARIIHAKRNPVDNCLSCFSIHFAGNNLAWSYDLREIGRYYRAYQTLMEHWHAVLPADTILDVQYESMVEDFEAQVRRILDFCGLGWNDRVLEFHKTERPVQTASVAQVRRPLYRSSVNRSARYGDLLQPLIEELRT